MAIEAIAATAAAPPPRTFDLGPATPQQADPIAQGRFEAALEKAEVPPALKGMLESLDKINGDAKSVADYARRIEASGGELTPGEMVNLTMRCQEFMFHCQLASNIANRSSDGVQQLFRQQG